MNGHWESLKQWLHVPTVFEPKSGPLCYDQTTGPEGSATTAAHQESQAARRVLDVIVEWPRTLTMTVDLGCVMPFMPRPMQFSIAIGQTSPEAPSSSRDRRVRDAGSSSKLRDFGASSGRKEKLGHD